MKDRARELLFPLTILAIVASLYSLARANASEKRAIELGMPHVGGDRERVLVTTIE